MADPRFTPFAPRYAPGVAPVVAAQAFAEVMLQRRSVRMFSDRPVERATIEWLIRAAQSAPSGANKQPWRFVCVQDAATKRRIREGAEAEEREFYEHRAGSEWLRDLEPFGTDADKGFLETAPWLIVVFQLMHADDGGQVYYRKESVGIACGMLLAAAQHAGLATLPHTPSPMAFLGTILGRPAQERPFLLIPVGYPAEDCVVPKEAQKRRPLDQTMVVV
jgi:nitroreductase